MFSGLIHHHSQQEASMEDGARQGHTMVGPAWCSPPTPSPGYAGPPTSTSASSTPSLSSAARKIINSDDVQEAAREADGYSIQSGTVTVIKDALIPSGTVI